MSDMQDSESKMSNLAIAKELYAAFARRDMSAVLAKLSRDVVWSEPENPFNPAAGRRHGHAGFLEWARIGRDSEEIESLEPQRFLVGQDAVAVVGHMRCRAKGTGRVYESDFVHLVTFANGLVTSFQEFFDTYAAAEAFRVDER
jgi:ketosteroid isomerase-like protein